MMDDIIAKCRHRLSHAQRPLFFYDDDVDGLCSFLILHHYTQRRGKGILLKISSCIQERYTRYVFEQGADVVVILDKAEVSEEFIDRCPVPIIWIDHHQLQQVRGDVLYCNPARWDGKPYPTSYWAYLIAERTQDLWWLAYTGCISDWQLIDDLQHDDNATDLADQQATQPQDEMFAQHLGRLIRILLFNLKGPSGAVKRSLEVLERVMDPDELLDGESPDAQHLRQRYAELQQTYDKLLQESTEQIRDNDPLLVYRYTERTTSLTAQLANELLYRYPDRIIVVARHKNEEFKCSLRCSPPLDLREVLQRVLVSVEGYGGGHAQACGACIKEDDFERFLDMLRTEATHAN